MPHQTKKTLPIGVPSETPACSLSPTDLGRRRVGLAELAATATQRVADDGGISLRFPFSDELLERACSTLRAETFCCPGFRYVLTVEPSDRMVELAVRADVPGHARWLRAVYLEEPDTGATHD